MIKKIRTTRKITKDSYTLDDFRNYKSDSQVFQKFLDQSIKEVEANPKNKAIKTAFFKRFKKLLDAKRKGGIQMPSYLQRFKKSKRGVILKKISYDSIVYPFSMDFKLINEFLKKK